MSNFKKICEQATRRPWRLTSDAGHPVNARITSTQRRHIAKVYADNTERDDTCVANARLLTIASNNVEELVQRLQIAIADESGWRDAARALLAKIEKEATE